MASSEGSLGGQTKRQDPDIVPLLGQANETPVHINGQHFRALLDSGSMISTISQSLYISLDPRPKLENLADFSLDS